MNVIRFIREFERLSDGTYMEAVASLFATIVPSAIMSALFIAALVAVESQVDRGAVFHCLGAAGSLISVARLGMTYRDSRVVRRDGLTREIAEEAECRFAILYLAFAAVIGVFGAHALLIRSAELHVVAAALLVGYAAGVAAGVALRPWIAVSSMTIAVAPAAAVAAVYAAPGYRMLALILVALLAGGIVSIMKRYRAETANITDRRMFAALARHDPLTGLLNRLALAEQFNAVAAKAYSEGGLAIHCLDLDDFKPVNDRFGHPVGDEILRSVAERLKNLLRGEDFAARLGGDEFVYVQVVANSGRNPKDFAWVIRDTLSRPYVVNGIEIVVGVSMGSAFSRDRLPVLDAIVHIADAALMEDKEQKASRCLGTRRRILLHAVQ